MAESRGLVDVYKRQVENKILKKKFKKIKKKLGIAIPQYAKFTEINYN